VLARGNDLTAHAFLLGLECLRHDVPIRLVGVDPAKGFVAPATPQNAVTYRISHFENIAIGGNFVSLTNRLVLIGAMGDHYLTYSAIAV